MPKKKKKPSEKSLRCPYCGARMEVRSAAEIYKDPENKDRLLVCGNYPACDSYVRLQKGTNRPLGTPADGPLRHLRIQAHRSFDSVWKSGCMSRDRAYQWMADFLGLRLSDAHIASFGICRCKQVIDKCNAMTAFHEQFVGR